MFVHEELLSIIFRLVNFGILVFICVCLFKRYILPTIREQMRDEEEEQIAMKERHTEIRNQEKIIEAFSDDQDKLCQVLQEKVRRWREAQEELARHREKEKEQRIYILSKRVDHQEQEFVRQHALQAMAPQVMHTASQVLQKQFGSSEQQKKYMHDVMSFLRKRRA